MVLIKVTFDRLGLYYIKMFTVQRCHKMSNPIHSWRDNLFIYHSFPENFKLKHSRYFRAINTKNNVSSIATNIKCLKQNEILEPRRSVAKNYVLFFGENVFCFIYLRKILFMKSCYQYYIRSQQKYNFQCIFKMVSSLAQNSFDISSIASRAF